MYLSKLFRILESYDKIWYFQYSFGTHTFKLSSEERSLEKRTFFFLWIRNYLKV